MKILGFFAALMLAVAAYGQGTANPGGGGGMNFIAPSPTLSPSSISNSFVLISNGAATNLNSVGISNVGGFFLGGAGIIGTNGSTSPLTVNMPTTFNGTLASTNLDARYQELFVWLRTGDNSPVAASNYWTLGPFANSLPGQTGDGMPIPSKYRYLRKLYVVVSGLANYGETNITMAYPTFSKYSADTSSFAETDHSVTFPFNTAWTNMPALKQKVFTSAGGKKSVMLELTNSVALPTAWFTTATNANGFDAFSLCRFSVPNANTIAMTNGFGAYGYAIFSTYP